jgi:DNA-binding FadR family transcriptional regulator
MNASDKKDTGVTTRVRAKPTFTVTKTANELDLVERQLWDYIVTNRLAPGQKLPSENELSVRLGVPRSTIREGLQALEAVGAITARRNNEHFMNKVESAANADSLPISVRFDERSLKELLEVRKSLELGFLADAASLLREDDFKALKEVVHQMRLNRKDVRAFLAEDMQFHKLLFTRLDNLVLLNIFQAFWKLFGPVAAGIPPTQDHLMQAANQHEALVIALKTSDVSQAEHLLQQQFRAAEECVTEFTTKFLCLV